MTERDLAHQAMDLKIISKRLAALSNETGKQITITASSCAPAVVIQIRDIESGPKFGYGTIEKIKYEDLLC